MIPTYTPNDIELWRELRAAFNINPRFLHFCFLSRSFERLWDCSKTKEELQELARKFLNSQQLDQQLTVGSGFLFLRIVMEPTVTTSEARSMFIDWNIQRLSTTPVQ